MKWQPIFLFFLTTVFALTTAAHAETEEKPDCDQLKQELKILENEASEQVDHAIRNFTLGGLLSYQALKTELAWIQHKSEAPARGHYEKPLEAIAVTCGFTLSRVVFAPTSLLLVGSLPILGVDYLFSSLEIRRLRQSISQACNE